MPLRRKLKKTRDYVRGIFSNPGKDQYCNAKYGNPVREYVLTIYDADDANPSILAGSPSDNNLPGRNTQQLGALGPEASTNQPAAIVTTSSGLHDALMVPKDTPGINLLGQANEIHLDVTSSSAGSPGIGTHTASANQMAPTNENIPTSYGTEPIGAGIALVPNRAREIKDPAGIQVSQVIVGETSTGWQSLKKLTRVLAPVTNSFEPVKEMVDMFLECVEECKMAEEAQVEYDALRTRLEGLFQDLQGHLGEGCSPRMTSSMENLCTSIRYELGYIKQKQDRNTRERYVAATDEASAILACYRRIEGYLQRLTLNANLSMWRISQEQTTESGIDRMSSRVDRLPASLPAWYNSAEGAELSRGVCTPGTRVNALANILGWARSGTGGGVYWLNGMAGTGKTTIAYSLCAELDAARQLGASYFCSRLREECRNVNLIIPSIAYQLARFSRPFQSALSAVLEEDPDAYGKLPYMQFDSLIARPMLEVQHALPDGLAVVIDALDECEQMESVGRILDVLLTKSTNLPVKFIVSSRPEPQIRDQMTEERAKNRLVLHEMDQGEVQADIEKYLRESLAPMSPSDENITAIAERAGVLFIYAATAVRYIGYDNFHGDPEDRLRTIMNGSQFHEDGETEDIDHLYMTILEAAFNNPHLRRVERDSMQLILYTVVCAREPLTISGLSKLLKINNINRVQAVLRPLWSVLHVVEKNELVATLHASFPDFMFDPTRSKAFHCDFRAHNRLLAEQCFNCIARTQPQFNICGLESSYIPDEEVANRERRVAAAVPSELLYASLYWAEHVKQGNCVPGIVELLRDFLCTRLLLWMEVLNLNRQIWAGLGCMELMTDWFDQLEAEPELVEIATDAQRFVSAFASNPVARSTPHIYVSMLAFWPRHSPIAKHYAKYTHGPVEPEGTALDRRQLAHLATWAFEAAIGAMAFSPDGLYIALGVGNNVLIVNSSSGKVTFGPLKGHTEAIKSIAFSSSGDHVLAASANSSDAIILGWDTRTGDTVLGPFPLVGHTSRILCIAFSPDCALIATGSDDKGLRIWDTQTGKALRSLELQYLADSVVFAPGGSLIAAGGLYSDTLQVWRTQKEDITLNISNDLRGVETTASPFDQPYNVSPRDSDTTNRMVDAQSGCVILKDIKNVGRICCIALSSDGKQVVSGSLDRKVQVWDTQSGRMILDPLEGHSDRIASVAFSPDGTRISSACVHGHVCTWNLQHQPHLLTPSIMKASPSRITCVKFSPDGTQFASGSKDGTLQILDAQTGEIIVGPVKAYSYEISAVDFLGDRVVSGSANGEICVHNALSGVAVLGPLPVLPGRSVAAIVYSPNGKFIMTVSDDGDTDIWYAETGNKALALVTKAEHVSSVPFSPDGTRVACSVGHLQVMDLATGKIVLGPLRPITDTYAIAYSPDGAYIASGGANSTIIAWDAYSGELALGPFIGHSDTIRSIAFSPDSAHLISGSDDSTIRIWDIPTGNMVFELLYEHNDAIASVSYSPDGTRILSHSSDMSVGIHDARSNEERVGYAMLHRWSLPLTISVHTSQALSRPISDFGDWVLDDEGPKKIADVAKNPAARGSVWVYSPEV